MFLSAPKPADCPVRNRSNKGAFTNRPPEKRKRFKPTDESDETPPPGTERHETEFVKWAEIHKKDGNADVLSYVLEGGPFKGEGGFEYKEQIKRVGARWIPNHLKTEECKDRKIKRGWWSAWDDKTLFALLHLRDDLDEPMWRCQAVDRLLVSTECKVLLRWLTEFYGEEQTRVVEEKVGFMLSTQGGEDQTDQAGQCDQYGPCDQPAHAHASCVYRQWPGDTVCSQCDVAIWDQFLDCHCEGAVWRRCPECWRKWRVDSTAAGDHENACCCARTQL